MERNGGTVNFQHETKWFSSKSKTLSSANMHLRASIHIASWKWLMVCGTSSLLHLCPHATLPLEEKSSQEDSKSSVSVSYKPSTSIFFYQKFENNATNQLPAPSNGWCLNPKGLLNGTPTPIHLAPLGGSRFTVVFHRGFLLWKLPIGFRKPWSSQMGPSLIQRCAWTGESYGWEKYETKTICREKDLTNWKIHQFTIQLRFLFSIWVFPKIGVPLLWMVYNGQPY